MKLLAFFVTVAALPALAWGPEGHEIVAQIAEAHLSPAALQAADELLGGQHQLPRVANWADQVRKSRSESAPWHFVDIPFAAEAFDAERDCVKHKGCIVEAIPHFVKILADSDNSPTARTEALKYIVHFVGDIHQPLHCGERNGDKGGNLCSVRWPGESKPVKLHLVWDVTLVESLLNTTDVEKLKAAITPEQAATWATGTTADWAWESHRLAVTKAYGEIPETGTHRLSDEYVTAGQQIVAEQLSKAGIRLAHLLNFALGN